jgi:hypothetical protein
MGECGRVAVLAAVLASLAAGGCEVIFGVPEPSFHPVGENGGSVELRVTIVGTAGAHGLPVRVTGPDGLDCPGQCTISVPIGTDVTFTAATVADTQFGGWSGAGALCGTAPECVVDARTPGELLVRWDLPTNVAFVSSRLYAADFAQGGEAHAFADHECEELAAAAHLPPGPYVAWVSTTLESALAHLGADASGWTRPDGEPFAASVPALLAGRILYPARLDEGGLDLGDAPMLTGTLADGSTDASGTCRDWTEVEAPGGGFQPATLGEAGGGTEVWTVGRTPGRLCRDKGHLLCLGKGKTDAPPTLPVPLVGPPPEDGPVARLWVSKAKLTPGPGGLARAEVICRDDGGAGANPRALPLLGEPGRPLGGRVLRDSSTGAPVTFVRPDGVTVAATYLDLAEGRLAAAPNLTLDGEFVAPGESVWLGSATFDFDTSQTCSGWESTGGNGFAGVVASSFVRADRPGACASAARVLCVDFPTRLFTKASH